MTTTSDVFRLRFISFQKWNKPQNIQQNYTKYGDTDDDDDDDNKLMALHKTYITHRNRRNNTKTYSYSVLFKIYLTLLAWPLELGPDPELEFFVGFTGTPLTPPPPPFPLFNIVGFARIFVQTGICRSAAFWLNLKIKRISI